MIVKRRGNYQVRIWIQTPEGRVKETIGTYPTRNEAREAEAKAVVNRTRGHQGTAWTVQQFAERWLTVYHGPETTRTAETTLQHHKHALRHFLTNYGTRQLRSFTPAEAMNYRAEFAWRATVVATMFNDAVRDDKLIKSPFAGLKTARSTGRGGIDPLTMPDIERLAEIAHDSLGFYGPHFASFILTAGWTGMRPGELCRLEWADILWDDRVILVRESKTGKPRRVPLAEAARDALASVVRSGDKVFHSIQGHDLKPYTYRYPWRHVRLVFEAQVPRDHWLAQRLRRDPEDHLVPYEMRHAFGSFLASRGLSAWEISEAMGNSPRECERTYVHPYRNWARDRTLAVFDAFEVERVLPMADRVEEGKQR